VADPHARHHQRVHPDPDIVADPRLVLGRPGTCVERQRRGEGADLDIVRRRFARRGQQRLQEHHARKPGDRVERVGIGQGFVQHHAAKACVRTSRA
jgi:hypothetical protein